MTVKVLYILGFVRSGSTILGDTLGALEGWFHLGELCGLWQMLRSAERTCSCGRPVRDCPLWGPVVAAAWGDLAPRTVARWQADALRYRHTRGLLRSTRAELLAHEPLRETIALTERLYAAIAEREGARVLVDSSKRPPNAALLPRVSGIDPYFVHLVRDPRGVAHARGKSRPGMITTGPARAARNWLILNWNADRIRRAYPQRSLLVRYEDFAARPRAVVETIARLVGEEPSALPFTDERTVRLAARHTLKGNPSRFAAGMVDIREDEAWKEELSRPRAALVTAMTLPLLARYGYAVSPGRSR